MTVFRFHQFGNGIIHAPIFKNDAVCGNGTSGAVAAVPAVNEQRFGGIADDSQDLIQISFGNLSGIKGNFIQGDRRGTMLAIDTVNGFFVAVVFAQVQHTADVVETEKRFNTPVRIILYGTKECYLIDGGVKALLPLSFDAGFLE